MRWMLVILIILQELIEGEDACMEEIQDEIKTERMVESEINDTIKQHGLT